MNPVLVRKIREMRNISAETLASELGMHISNYTKFENGSRDISEDKLTELAAVLKCSGDLLTRCPVLYSIHDLLYYVKKLVFVSLGKCQIEKGANGYLIHVTDETALFYVNEFREQKFNFVQEKLSEEEFVDWLLQKPTMLRDYEFPSEKWKEIREKCELKNPDTDAKLMESIDASFAYYLIIEDGVRVPTGKTLLEIASVLGTTPEFLLNDFSFKTQRDLELFLITTEIIYPNSFRLADGGFIKFDIPQVQYLLERLYKLQNDLEAGKITRTTYDMEVLKC